MAKKKNWFDNTELLKYADELDRVAGTMGLIQATEAAMKAAKTEINNDVTNDMQPGNLPAKGRYSTGKTLDSLDRDMTVKWDGNIATLPLGFDMDKSGITSILLMNGTPKMQPVKGLKNDLTAKASKKIRAAEEKAILDVLKGL